MGRLGESLSADCEIYFAVVSRIVVCEAFDRNIEMKFSRRLYVRVYNFKLMFLHFFEDFFLLGPLQIISLFPENHHRFFFLSFLFVLMNNSYRFKRTNSLLIFQDNPF